MHELTLVDTSCMCILSWTKTAVLIPCDVHHTPLPHTHTHTHFQARADARTAAAMFEGLVTWALSKVLGKYVENFDKSQLKISLYAVRLLWGLEGGPHCLCFYLVLCMHT